MGDPTVDDFHPCYGQTPWCPPHHVVHFQTSIDQGDSQPIRNSPDVPWPTKYRDSYGPRDRESSWCYGSVSLRIWCIERRCEKCSPSPTTCEQYRFRGRGILLVKIFDAIKRSSRIDGMQIWGRSFWLLWQFGSFTAP